MTEERETASEIATRCGVSKGAVTNWMRRPDFPNGKSVVRAGRTRDGFLRSEVDEFLKTNGLPNRAFQQAITRSTGNLPDEPPQER